jgi:hypothetical protein
MVADLKTGAKSQPSSSPLLPGLGTKMGSWAKLSLPGLHCSCLTLVSAGRSWIKDSSSVGKVTFTMSCKAHEQLRCVAVFASLMKLGVDFI